MRRMLMYIAGTVILLFVFLFSAAVFSNGKTHNFENSGKQCISVTAPIVHEHQKEAFNLIISDDISEKAEFTVKYFTPDDYNQKITVDLSSGTYSDIIIIPSTALDYKLLSNKHIVPVNDIISEDVIDRLNISRSFFGRLQNDGKLRGIPYDVFAAGVFCNKSIFEKYNLTFPKDYEQLKNTVTVLRQNGVIPFAVNLNTAGTYLFDYIISDVSGDSEDLSFDDYKRTAAIVDELNNLGAFPENFYRMNDYDTRSLFIEGKAAMIVEDTSFCLSVSELYNMFRDDKPDIEIEYFPSLGASTGNERRLLYDLGNYVILFTDNVTSSPQKTEATIEFVNHIFEEKISDAFFSETYSITTIKTARPHSYSLPQMIDFFNLIDRSQLYIAPLKNNYGKISKKKLIRGLENIYVHHMNNDEIWEGN